MKTLLWKTGLTVLGVTAMVFAGCSGTDSPTESTPPEPPKSGYVYTYAGNGVEGYTSEGNGLRQTSLYLPVDVAFDDSNNPYILDWNNHRVLNLENGKCNELIGGTFGSAPDGVADQIGLNHPTHVAIRPGTNKLILAAWHNSIIMELDMGTGMIAKIIGTGCRCHNGDSTALQTGLDLPSNIAFFSDGTMVFCDQANYRIRTLQSDGRVRTIAGKGQFNPAYSGDGGPATEAEFGFERDQNANPSGKIVIDDQDQIYIADTQNHCVRFINSSGIISTVAGVGGSPGFSGDGGQAINALLFRPRDVALDSDGNLYIADTSNYCVRKVDTTTGIITTVAGQGGVVGYAGDGGPATQARFSFVMGIELDADDNLYIADANNARIRIVYK